MNKKIITLIVLAAGIAAFFFDKKRNRIREAAEDAYDNMKDTFKDVKRKTENVFS